MTSERIFQLGIALAGGSTRGAYSAGVMDFLFEALQEWEKVRNSHPATSTDRKIPPWFVHLHTLAGTSAGGITAAIATGTICTPHQPLQHTHTSSMPPPRNNPLYNVWVEQVTPENLFDISDLCPNKPRQQNHPVPIHSLFSSKFMYETSKVGLYAERTDVSKPTWAENLRLFITTANLRGIPYSLEQFGAANDDFNEFRMKRHRDWIGFDTSESSFQGLHHLDLHSSRAPTEKGNNAWDLLRVAASATAALPLFFPAVRIALSTDLYTCRIAGECPDWPEGMPSTYEYDAVDGGVFHNEPLGLVRDSIEHDHPGALDQNSKLTKGAVILLHPSPPRDSYDVNPETKSCNMLSILGRVLGALINEANFKEHELKEISDVENISRFMIAPVRKGRKSRQPVLATDTMKGFGGIIHKDVRHHDFQLGRSNCKQFLQNHFVITPEMALNNPIFGKEALEFVTKVDDGKREVIPIIPLYGTAATDFEEPTWPSFNEKRRAELETDLHNIIDLRIGLIFKCFAHNMGFYKYNGPFNFGFQSMWNATVDKILHMSKEKVMSSVDEETKNALTQFL